MTHASTPRLLGVSAVGRHVLIDVEPVDVRAAIEALCAGMLRSPGTDAIDRLSIRQSGDRYTVSDGAGTSVAGTPSDVAWGVRYLLVRVLMHARPDLVFLHAAGVVDGDRAVLIVGPSGCGKSTLATHLVERGFEYLGDDVMPIDPRTGQALPLPLTPAVRVPADATPVASQVVRLMPKAEQPVSTDRVAVAAVRPAVLVFPAYTGGLAIAEAWTPARAALELLRYSLNARPHGENLVRAMTNVVVDCVSIGLRYGDARAAVEAIADQCRGAEPLSA